MAGLADFRSKYPEYNDIPDNVLADKLYQKHYSDMPRQDFDAKMGLSENAPSKTESFIKGIDYGSTGQPIDLIGSTIATVGAGGPNMMDSLKQNINDAQQESVQKIGAPATENPFSFGAGQAIGNALAVAGPAAKAVSAAVSPLARIGVPLSKAVLEGTGVMGTLGRGAAEGAVGSALLGDNPEEGAMGGAVGAPLAKIAGKIAQPIKASGAANKMSAILEKAGVSLTPGQATGNKTLQNIEASMEDLPFASAKMADFREQQGKQFTKAVMNKAGLPTDTADPKAIGILEKKIGSKFDKAIMNTEVPVNDDLKSALSAIKEEYSIGIEPDQKQIVYDYIDAIANRGSLEGKVYKDLRSKLGRTASSTQDPQLKSALMQIRDAVDTTARSNMDEATGKLWDEANSNWRNFLSIRDAMKTNAGVASDEIVPPAALMSAVRKNTQNQFSRGTGDLNELSRAAYNVIPSKVNNSGTAQRQLYNNLMTYGIPAVGGGLVGASSGDGTQDTLEKASLGLLLGLTAPKVLSSMYMSGPGQSYLKKGIPFAGKALNKKEAATIGALLGGSVNQERTQQ